MATGITPHQNNNNGSVVGDGSQRQKQRGKMMPYSTIRNVCGEGQHCSILIVDDEQVVLETMSAVFTSQANITIVTAKSLSEALELICTAANLQLVILDLWLENNDPIAALRQVVKACGGRVGVVAMSGDYSLEDGAYENGAIDFWHKPVEVDVVGRTKLLIMNQRKHNLLLDRNKELVKRNNNLIEELDIIKGNVIIDPDEAIKELDTTTWELKQELQTLMTRAT